MYGWRGKIGLLVPSLNTTMEHDFHRLAPEGVSVHVTRVPTEAEGTIEALEDMGRSATECAELLAPARTQVAVFGCTSASFVNGAAWTDDLEASIAQTIGSPAVSTATAMVRSLRHVGAKRVAVLTPYVEATNDRLRTYLADAGFEVVDLKGLAILDMYSHADISSEELYKAALDLDTSDADALFIACTQLKAVDILDALEAELKIPAISAVQSSLWAALNEIGDLPVTGYGSLLAGTKVER
ncbi:maleate cis-trans isomerase family protein [Aeromicrobium wangtongii]|uniref:maleate cis-trans isomerase family protein n=1 Tax=Aeromicrobium wangtongii TaxID=2969247 RepID=UPI0020180C8E|nr:aspartate/glutamate racemase family protein [Aeromicrobium wangtongii]MCL3819383.1 aspartate/glutamate racemase family protein [Aeromicrobium wangtongii]